MSSIQIKQLITHLSEFTTQKRLRLFQEKIIERTSKLTIVLEDIFHSQNTSAVLRTADCFGIQNIHIIENRNQHLTHPSISLGSSKWLTKTIYNKQKENTQHCLEKLRNDGFQILATTPYAKKNIYDVNTDDNKIALLFGSEQEGLSEIGLELADEKITIPMFGFTESYNISVAAALCIQSLIQKIRASNKDWQLSDKEQDIVLLGWLRNSIKESSGIEKRFLQKMKEI